MIPMPTYTLRGRVTPEGELRVELPPGIAAGEAKVTVELDQEAEEREYPRGDPRAVLATFRRWEARGWPSSGRSQAEIDAAIEAERNSWGDE
jgi:hypothetical protein